MEDEQRDEREKPTTVNLAEADKTNFIYLYASHPNTQSTPQQQLSFDYTAADPLLSFDCGAL